MPTMNQTLTLDVDIVYREPSNATTSRDTICFSWGCCVPSTVVPATSACWTVGLLDLSAG